jgi:hypothetical protein
MEVIMTNTETNVFAGKIEQLPIPHTLPNNTQGGFETMLVVEDQDDNFKIHVELADGDGGFDGEASPLGCYLADIARAIARDYADVFGENALAEIRDGFVYWLDAEKSKVDG